MKIALTIWNGRIAPVFDVAGQALLIETQDRRKMREIPMVLPENSLTDKIQRLKDHGVALLICGAISREAMQLAQGNGIEVHGFIAGDVQDVWTAWRDDRLNTDGFAMPGCGQRRRCCCRGKHRNSL